MQTRTESGFSLGVPRMHWAPTDADKGQKYMISKTIRWAFISALCILPASFAQAQSPVGVWRGEWHSGSTGHHGPMRANIQLRADGAYQARYVGRFALVVPFAYRVTMYPQLDAYGNTVLTAEKPLGPWMGTYRMNAQVFGNQMSGGFQAAGDNGTIRMQRIR